MRPNKKNWYFQIAKDISERSPCTRRKCGTLLVKDEVIVATGYNGSCRGSLNCGEDVLCLKDKYGEISYTSYIHCPAIHGEVNAVINAARSGISTIGTTLYLYSSKEYEGEPCIYCRRVLINAGIKDCYFMNGKGKISHRTIEEWIIQENKWMKKEEKDIKSG